MKVCAEPNCPTLTDGETRCDLHRKAKRKREDKRRPSANERGYGAEWRRIRRTFLQANPVCTDCGGEATVADHAPLTRAELVAHGVPMPDSPAFLKPRCKSCHDRKTVREDGGFGREKVANS